MQARMKEPSMLTPTVFADGFHLPECPRWHDGQLWMSDMWGRTIYRFDAAQTRHTVHRFDDDDPGGLGWLPDGRPLVVGMEQRRLYRLEPDGVVVHADLAAVCPWQCNDMIVAAEGTAYVTHFGYDMWGGTTAFRPAPLIRVKPDGRVDTVADDLLCPNGIALSADGRTLYVAEPGGSRISRFTVARDGSLGDREVFAEIAPVAGQQYAPPDGICLDAAGAVWAAEPIGKRILRIEAGGRVTSEITFAQHPLAVALGGPDRRTLFVCCSEQISKPHRAPQPQGTIRTLAVTVPGSGRP
jgi:sugar lactone lactonase YvrE